jgi:hypothetical protein
MPCPVYSPKRTCEALLMKAFMSKSSSLFRRAWLADDVGHPALAQHLTPSSALCVLRPLGKTRSIE